MTLLLRFLRNKWNGFLVRYRTYYYGLVFESFGYKSRVLGAIKVLKPQRIHIDENTSINPGCFLNGKHNIIVGSHVHLSPRVMIHTGGLDYNKDMVTRPHVSAPVTIEDGAWIGAGAVVNPGVTVGAGSVIGSGAVVTKDIQVNSVVVGVPAKVIKNIIAAL